MKIFIIGSNNGLNDGEKSLFQQFCETLGYHLAEYKITLTLCSPYNDSADRAVLEGVLNHSEPNLTIELHYPHEERTVNEWEKIIRKKFKNIKVHPFIHPFEPEIEQGIRFAWLYSQMQALESANIIILIGGNLTGSANLLLRVAEAKDKNVVPLNGFGGLASHFYRRNFYTLSDTWGNDLELIENNSNEDIPKFIKTILNGSAPRESSLTKNSEPIFFLSYPRARPHEADFVEMHLRRRGYTVIRDENDINESIDIPNAIKENINKADVFVAIWCQEYACSPWCFDELSIALNKKRSDKYSLWILCFDETRIVHPDARNLLHFKVKTRDEIEGRLSVLLEKYRK